MAGNCIDLETEYRRQTKYRVLHRYFTSEGGSLSAVEVAKNIATDLGVKSIALYVATEIRDPSVAPEILAGWNVVEFSSQPSSARRTLCLDCKLWATVEGTARFCKPCLLYWNPAEKTRVVSRDAVGDSRRNAWAHRKVTLDAICEHPEFPRGAAGRVLRELILAPHPLARKSDVRSLEGLLDIQPETIDKAVNKLIRDGLVAEWSGSRFGVLVTPSDLAAAKFQVVEKYQNHSVFHRMALRYRMSETSDLGDTTAKNAEEAFRWLERVVEQVVDKEDDPDEPDPPNADRGERSSQVSFGGSGNRCGDFDDDERVRTKGEHVDGYSADPSDRKTTLEIVIERERSLRKLDPTPSGAIGTTKTGWCPAVEPVNPGSECEVCGYGKLGRDGKPQMVRFDRADFCLGCLRTWRDVQPQRLDAPRRFERTRLKRPKIRDFAESRYAEVC